MAFLQLKLSHFLTIQLLFLLSVSSASTGMNIFLLGGADNMLGQGGVTSSKWDGIVPSECQPDTQILKLNNRSQWETALEPLHQGMGLGGPNTSYGVGPGMAFANSVLPHLHDIVALVPCAVENSTISQWQRGTPNYDRALARARAAVSYSRGGTIRALLWYQGEADTNEAAPATAYRGKLIQLFNDLREDLESPYLPIFQVALAKAGQFKGTVREAQLNIGLPNVFCVDTKELNVTTQNDRMNIHLDTPSQVKLGKALATAFLNISSPLV